MSNCIFFLLCTAAWPVVKAVMLTVKPNPVYEGEHVTIRCSIEDASRIDQIFSLIVRRKDIEEAEYVNFGVAASGENDGNAFFYDIKYTSVANVTGRLYSGDAKEESFVQIDMSSFSSIDEGYYLCVLDYLNYDFEKQTTIARMKIIVKSATLPKKKIVVSDGQAQLQIDAYPTYKITPLSVMCLPTNFSKDYILTSLTLKRQRSNDSDAVVMATASTVGTDGKVTLNDTSLEDLTSVTGKCDNNDTEGSFIQILFQKMTSSYAGIYSCTVGYTKSGTSQDATASRVIAIQSTKNPISTTRVLTEVLEMRIIPRTVYEGFPMTIRCDIEDDKDLGLFYGLILKQKEKSEDEVNVGYVLTLHNEGRPQLEERFKKFGAKLSGKCDTVNKRESFLQLEIPEMLSLLSAQYLCHCNFFNESRGLLNFKIYENIDVKKGKEPYPESLAIDGAAELTITPNLVYEGIPQIVRCSVGNVSASATVHAIQLKKVIGEHEVERLVASAATNQFGGKAVIRDINLERSASVKGKCDNDDKTGSFIELSMWSVKRSDGEVFLCYIDSADSDGVKVEYSAYMYVNVFKIESLHTKTFESNVANLIINPFPVTEHTVVSFRCSIHNVSDVNLIHTIQLKRKLDNQTEQFIIAAAVPEKNNSGAQLLDYYFKSRATVQGKADNKDKTGSFVQTVFSRMTKSDSGKYGCYISYGDPSYFSKTSVATYYVEVEDLFLIRQSSSEPDSLVIPVVVVVVFFLLAVALLAKWYRRGDSNKESFAIESKKIGVQIIKTEIQERTDIEIERHDDGEADKLMQNQDGEEAVKPVENLEDEEAVKPVENLEDEEAVKPMENQEDEAVKPITLKSP